MPEALAPGFVEAVGEDDGLDLDRHLDLEVPRRQPVDQALDDAADTDRERFTGDVGVIDDAAGLPRPPGQQHQGGGIGTLQDVAELRVAPVAPPPDVRRLGQVEAVGDELVDGDAVGRHRPFELLTGDLLADHHAVEGHALGAHGGDRVGLQPLRCLAGEVGVNH